MLWSNQLAGSRDDIPRRVLNNRSPAELFLGQPLRTKLSLMKPERPNPFFRGPYQQRMAQQFDKKHGAKRVEFNIGDKVQFVNYRNGKTLWLFGEVVTKKGLIFGIRSPQIANRIVTRHANAMRLTHALGTDQTWPNHDEEPKKNQSPVRAPQIQQNVTPHGQLEQNEEQERNQQQTPVLRRSERATKRVRFLSPSMTGQRHNIRQ
ncbi:hypothetical protein niasHT_014294 [Heterodera trifolii]|uniref:Uncharacterized protein n=1 Tax=Heterodera trifolii TaxID=157864 RepID=A0ABD2KVC9_9BILA